MSGKYGNVEKYLAVLPPRCEWNGGTCIACSYCYAMEMCGILTGQPVVQLSQLYLNYHGGNALASGVASENLWPISIGWGSATYTTGVTSENMLTALTTAPGTPAEMDAPYHRMTSQYLIETAAQAKAAIDAGQMVIAFWPPNHQVCIMDYDDTTGVWLGLDPRDSSPEPFRQEYSSLFPTWVVTGAIFTNPPTVVLNIDMAELVTLAGELNMSASPITVTQAWAAQLQALAGIVVNPPPVGGNPPPPPPPAGGPVSPDGTMVPPASLAVDNVGNNWSLGVGGSPVYGPPILLNGAQAGSGMAVLIEINHGGVAYFKNGQGNWYTYANGSFHTSTAP